MEERFVASDYVVADYWEGGERYLKLRLDVSNSWWPGNRNCVDELSVLITSTIDRLGEFMPEAEASMRLNLESSTRYGKLKCSLDRFGTIELIRCAELFRIFKETCWSAIDRVPPRRQGDKQSAISCEAGTAFTAWAKQKGVEVNYHLDLPGWVSWTEFNEFITAAKWWGGRLEASAQSPNGQLLLRGSTSSQSTEGRTMAANGFQNFIQRIAQAHYGNHVS